MSRWWSTDSTSSSPASKSPFCMARRRKKQRRKAPSKRRSHEHFRTVYQTTDRDHALDGGSAGGRPRRLSFVAGVIVAGRQLPDAHGDSPAAGSRSADDGI